MLTSSLTADMIRRKVAPPSSSPASASPLARGALLKCAVAVALEHQLGRPPNVDLGYQSARLMKSRPGLPMTRGNAGAAHVRLIVWCKACGRQVEPDSAKMAASYGADTSVLDWRERLGCSESGCRDVDFVVTGTRQSGLDHRSRPPALAAAISSSSRRVMPSAMAWISKEPRRPAPLALSS